jgi:hypothetical protein
MVTARDDGLAGATRRSNEDIGQNKLPVHGRGIPMGATILTCDSYYLDLIGRDILQELEVLYLCTLQSCRFNTLYH